MSLAQARSLDLLASSPARYHCTTDAPLVVAAVGPSSSISNDDDDSNNSNHNNDGHNSLPPAESCRRTGHTLYCFKKFFKKYECQSSNNTAC